ncbi:hypothetical protein JOD20_003683 [Herpetosiphon giganteus]|nr:hypothetical protein [Herpetosiphon giganteus]
MGSERAPDPQLLTPEPQMRWARGQKNGNHEAQAIGCCLSEIHRGWQQRGVNEGSVVRGRVNGNHEDREDREGLIHEECEVWG